MFKINLITNDKSLLNNSTIYILFNDDAKSKKKGVETSHIHVLYELN